MLVEICFFVLALTGMSEGQPSVPHLTPVNLNRVLLTNRAVTTETLSLPDRVPLIKKGINNGFFKGCRCTTVLPGRVSIPDRTHSSVSPTQIMKTAEMNQTYHKHTHMNVPLVMFLEITSDLTRAVKSNKFLCYKS